jgi:hypothetical protein
VRVYRGGDFAQLVNFRPLTGSSYQGRARVALADVTGDGRADLTVSGLYGDGTHVSVYTGTSLGAGTSPALAFPQFVLTGAGFAGGVNLAAGDLNADGRADLIFGSAFDGSRVLALSGRDLAQGSRTTLVDFTPAGSGYGNGVRVGARDLDGDGHTDLLLGSGEGSGNRVLGYLGTDLTPTGGPVALDLTVYAGYTGGLNVG